MTKYRNILVGCLLGLVSAAVSIGLDAMGTLTGVENITWDMRTRTMAPSADVPIKIIYLDQGSLDWGESRGLKSWPWRRDVFPYLLSFCRRANVKSVAFDVHFLKPSDDEAADNEFADAIAATPQYVGPMIPSPSAGTLTRWPQHAPASPFRVEGLDLWLTAHSDADVVMPTASFNFAPLSRGTRVLGHVRGAPDAVDNIVRRVYPVQMFDGQVIPLLGAAPYAADAQMPPMTMDGDELLIGDRRISLDAKGRAILHYYRPREGTPFAFDTYPVAAILDSEFAIQEGKPPTVSPESLKDCYVIFGASALSLYDVKATPFSKLTPGPEMHATMLANLITGQLIAPAGHGGVLMFTLVWSVLCGIATARGGKAWWLALVAGIAIAVPILLGIVGYKALVWWPVMAPMLASGLAVTAGIVYIYTTEYKQRRLIRGMFNQYLSPAVIDELVAKPDSLKLGGIDKELSIFFSDMEHFSKISEEIGAKRVTELLNAVLSEMSQIIFEEDGTLDKYVGDAVVAFWNAPTDQPDHAVRAVRASLRCKRRLAERAEEFKAMAGGHRVRVRIGLHVGEVVVGNLGSPQRFNYSMMGDAANLASRLEGANKSFGTDIICSQELWAKTDGQFFGRELGTVTVVGRDAPVRIIEPLGIVGDPLPAGLSRFARALALSHEGLIDEAIAILQTLPGDPVAQAYVNYLRGLDPSFKWDGVWRLSAK